MAASLDRSTLMKLWPKDAHDADGAVALVKLGFPAVEPVMPDMARSLMGQGPVVNVFIEFLGTMGAAAVPHVRVALTSKRELQVRNALSVVELLHPEVVRELTTELELLLTEPSVQGLHVDALHQLARAEAKTHAPVTEWEALFRTRIMEQLRVLNIIRGGTAVD